MIFRLVLGACSSGKKGLDAVSCGLHHIILAIRAIRLRLAAGKKESLDQNTVSNKIATPKVAGQPCKLGGSIRARNIGLVRTSTSPRRSGRSTF